MEKALDGALVWFRRDLRVDDHAALYHALRAARRVWCAFVFDTDILDALPRVDRRVEFIRDSLVELDGQLRLLGRSHGTEGTGLIVCHGKAVDEIPRLAAELGVQAVYANHDDEPASLVRDAAVRGRLAHAGIALHTSKDHVVFERSELLNAAGQPYMVFTPYRTAWLRRLEPFFVRAYEVARHARALAPLSAPGAGPWPGPPQEPRRSPCVGLGLKELGSGPAFLESSSLHAPIPSLEALGFAPSNLRDLQIPTGSSGAHELLGRFLERIDRYGQTRDFPAVKGPSYLGVHLRFGTVSVRTLARQAWHRMQSPERAGDGAQTWLSELIWRDFYHQVLHHHPHVVGHAFRREFDALAWEHGKHADALFAAWCEGRTGYPLVDAAMLQLERTGYMHNRLRMVSASFLVKDLGIDWRRGEAHFARHLNDFDLAANNGGWQWCASTGCDAQPWFRIFNPVAQSEKFDPQGRFIRRYLPQLAGLADRLIHAPWLARPVDLQAAGIELGRNYPVPLVMHDAARARTLERFAAVRALRASRDTPAQRRGTP